MRISLSRFLSFVLLSLFFVSMNAAVVNLSLEKFGARTTDGFSIGRAIKKAAERRKSDSDTLLLVLPAGRYTFNPDKALVREYYISNHDQDNPKRVGLELEKLKNVVLDCSGAEFICLGRMLPVAVIGCENLEVRNLSVDFSNPHISQVKIVDNDTLSGIIRYRPEPWVDFDVADSTFIAKGQGWSIVPEAGIAFEPQTRHLVYRTSDIGVGVRGISVDESGLVSAPWRNPQLIPGTVVAMRSYQRPAPGIFVDSSRNIAFSGVRIHYAEGMGLLAQLTENITLHRFAVCLRGADDPRYFTTQADATHFSSCRGHIESVGGLYEGMMDDAINVHGTYLKVKSIVDNRTVIGEYMHPQTFGFAWGFPGDSVQFVSSETMDMCGRPLTIQSIRPADTPGIKGAKCFELRLQSSLPDELLDSAGRFGIENLTWTPSVNFSDNIVRNNRARGALFSTPRHTVVERNVFDHTSGCAILLSGDCNGWFETGSCRDVTIRDNRFVNALTNMFQFTNAVISIYPVIPDLKAQQGYFHSDITIVGNRFEVFDAPLLYAKSVDGLLFMDNQIVRNNDYAPFHWNRAPILLERVNNASLQAGH